MTDKLSSRLTEDEQERTKTPITKTKKVNLNFKVDEEMKILLNELVIIKTVKDHKKSSQHAVFQEALITLMQKYTDEYSKQEK